MLNHGFIADLVAVILDVKQNWRNLKHRQADLVQQAKYLDNINVLVDTLD